MSKRKFILANNPLLSGPAMGDRERGGIPYRELKLSLIERDPNQPRRYFDEERLEELTNSIKTYGVLSPVLVRPSKTPGRYVLIAGERRCRAAERAGLENIPVLVDQEEESSEERTLAMQLVENLQRADLSPLERAHAIGALKESYNLSVREIGERLGISKSMVQRSLDILKLPADLLNALKEGASESKILLLSKIDDPQIRASYLNDLDVLTRTKLKNISDSAANRDEDAGSGKLSPEDQRIVDEIQKSLGTRVRMIRSAANLEAGRVVVDFYNEEDLKELFRRLIAD